MKLFIHIVSVTIGRGYWLVGLEEFQDPTLFVPENSTVPQFTFRIVVKLVALRPTCQANNSFYTKNCMPESDKIYQVAKGPDSIAYSIEILLH